MTATATLTPGTEQLGPQPVHRHACGVVGAILGANLSVRSLKINPGGGSDGGAILEHLHRARKSSLVTLDLTGIGLAERGGAKLFESLIGGKCGFIRSFHLGHNKLTDLAVGPMIVEVRRDDLSPSPPSAWLSAPAALERVFVSLCFEPWVH